MSFSDFLGSPSPGGSAGGSAATGSLSLSPPPPPPPPPPCSAGFAATAPGSGDGLLPPLPPWRAGAAAAAAAAAAVAVAASVAGAAGAAGAAAAAAGAVAELEQAVAAGEAASAAGAGGAATVALRPCAASVALAISSSCFALIGCASSQRGAAGALAVLDDGPAPLLPTAPCTGPSSVRSMVTAGFARLSALLRLVSSASTRSAAEGADDDWPPSAEAVVEAPRSFEGSPLGFLLL